MKEIIYNKLIMQRNKFIIARACLFSKYGNKVMLNAYIYESQMQIKSA